jgi:hypothetical protein
MWTEEVWSPGWLASEDPQFELWRSFGHSENNTLLEIGWDSFAGKVIGYELVQTGYLGSIPAVVGTFSSHLLPRLGKSTALQPM